MATTNSSSVDSPDSVLWTSPPTSSAPSHHEINHWQLPSLACTACSLSTGSKPIWLPWWLNSWSSLLQLLVLPLPPPQFVSLILLMPIGLNKTSLFLALSSPPSLKTSSLKWLVSQPSEKYGKLWKNSFHQPPMLALWAPDSNSPP